MIFCITKHLPIINKKYTISENITQHVHPYKFFQNFSSDIQPCNSQRFEYEKRKPKLDGLLKKTYRWESSKHTGVNKHTLRSPRDLCLFHTFTRTSESEKRERNKKNERKFAPSLQRTLRVKILLQKE